MAGPNAPRPLTTRHDNDEDIARWVAADEYANNLKRLKAIERQAAKAVPLDDILSTIGRLAAGLTQSQRRALAAVILQAVFGDAP